MKWGTATAMKDINLEKIIRNIMKMASILKMGFLAIVAQNPLCIHMLCTRDAYTYIFLSIWTTFFKTASPIDVMTEKETQAIKLVYDRFIRSESADWSDLNSDLESNLEFFGWLTDKELVNEVKVKQLKHSRGKIFRCTETHEKDEDCFAPYILEAIGYIINLWDKTRILTEKNRYILLYYVSMAEMGLIFEV